MNIVWSVFTYLIAPHKNEAKEQYGVRLLLTGLAVGTASTLAVHMVWAAENFVPANDVKELIISDITEKIISAKIRQCEASEQPNISSEAKQFFQQRLDEQQRRYQEKTGQQYHLPDCRDLI